MRRHIQGGTAILSRKETETAARKSAEEVGRVMRALGVTSEVYDVEYRPVQS